MQHLVEEQKKVAFSRIFPRENHPESSPTPKFDCTGAKKVYAIRFVPKEQSRKDDSVAASKSQAKILNSGETSTFARGAKRPPTLVSFRGSMCDAYSSFLPRGKLYWGKFLKRRSSCAVGLSRVIICFLKNLFWCFFKQK